MISLLTASNFSVTQLILLSVPTWCYLQLLSKHSIFVSQIKNGPDQNTLAYCNHRITSIMNNRWLVAFVEEPFSINKSPVTVAASALHCRHRPLINVLSFLKRCWFIFVQKPGLQQSITLPLKHMVKKNNSYLDITFAIKVWTSAWLYLFTFRRGARGARILNFVWIILVYFPRRSWGQFWPWRNIMHMSRNNDFHQMVLVTRRELSSHTIWGHVRQMRRKFGYRHMQWHVGEGWKVNTMSGSSTGLKYIPLGLFQNPICLP